MTKKQDISFTGGKLNTVCSAADIGAFYFQFFQNGKYKNSCYADNEAFKAKEIDWSLMKEVLQKEAVLANVRILFFVGTYKPFIDALIKECDWELLTEYMGNHGALCYVLCWKRPEGCDLTKLAHFGGMIHEDGDW